MQETNQKITPFLWFDDNAEQAVTFYTSIFKKSAILATTYYPEGAPGQAGTVMTISFVLHGQQFTALNGGPHFRFNESISFVVQCEDQKELDELWESLLEGGGESQCGWLKDKFGLSWQLVPAELARLLSKDDPAGARRVMQAILKMKKLDIETLRRAHRG